MFHFIHIAHTISSAFACNNANYIRLDFLHSLSIAQGSTGTRCFLARQSLRRPGSPAASFLHVPHSWVPGACVGGVGAGGRVSGGRVGVWRGLLQLSAPLTGVPATTCGRRMA